MKPHYHLRVVNDELNLITLMIVVLAVALLIYLGLRLWRMICLERERIRAELPGLIVGELLTRDEFVHLYERIFEIETKLEYIETRLDAHIAEAQQIAGDG